MEAMKWIIKVIEALKSEFTENISMFMKNDLPPAQVTPWVLTE